MLQPRERFFHAVRIPTGLRGLEAVPGRSDVAPDGDHIHAETAGEFRRQRAQDLEFFGDRKKIRIRLDLQVVRVNRLGQRAVDPGFEVRVGDAH